MGHAPTLPPSLCQRPWTGGRGLHPGQVARPGTMAPRQSFAGGAEVRAGSPGPAKLFCCTPRTGCGVTGGVPLGDQAWASGAL